jgi:hypothetical protein
MPAWTFQELALVDASTGEQIDGAGGLGPGGPAAVEPDAVFASLSPAVLEADRTLRFSATLTGRQSRRTPAFPDAVTVQYWHLDRFVKEVSVGCTEQ